MNRVLNFGRCCRGKKGYKTQSLAVKAMHRTFGWDANKRLNTYLCPHCALWHMGHKIGKKIYGKDRPDERCV